MSGTIRRLTLIAACLLLVLIERGYAEDKPSKAELKKKYGDLIEQLASPNDKPEIIRRGPTYSVRFPADYDVKAQKRIHAVRQTLHDNFEEALPFLIKAIDDDRYCMTISWGDVQIIRNCSIGTICKDVIASQLEVFSDLISAPGRRNIGRYDYPISKKWWKKRKGNSLVELQIEAIDWAIEQREDEPEDELVKGRENEVRNLKELREEIEESGRPAKPHGMYYMITSDKGRLR